MGYGPATYTSPTSRISHLLGSFSELYQSESRGRSGTRRQCSGAESRRLTARCSTGGYCGRNTSSASGPTATPTGRHINPAFSKQPLVCLGEHSLSADSDLRSSREITDEERRGETFPDTQTNKHTHTHIRTCRTTRKTI